MKAKTGWIIEIVSGLLRSEYGRTFFGSNSKYATLVLANASVIKSRWRARSLASDAKGEEVVRKVELDEHGRAVQIIPGR